MAAASSSYMAFSTAHMVGKRQLRNNSKRVLTVSAQQQQQQQQEMVEETTKIDTASETLPVKKQPTKPRPVEPQINVKSKNMGKEYGGEWLSSTTRHVRIFAAYIDPVTCEMDQTQMDKLTLILDPTNEFVWDDVTCTKC